MTDPTVGKWSIGRDVNDDNLAPTPESDAAAELWRAATDAIRRASTPLAGTATVPPGPLKAPDMDEIRRVCEQATTARPEGDRLAMPRPMFDRLKVKGLPETRPAWAGADLLGMRIEIDDNLPDGTVELRDRSRVVRRYIDDLAGKHEAQIVELLGRALATGTRLELDPPIYEQVPGGDGITMRITQPYRFVSESDEETP